MGGNAAAAVLTCADIWNFYLNGHVARKCQTQERHLYAWKALAQRFANLRPLDVTREVIAAHLKARLPTKPTTVWCELRLMTASWNYAVKRRLVEASDIPPLCDLDLPSPPSPRHRWLREEEVDRILAAAANYAPGPRLSRIQRFVWLALETASRKTAILELRWEQVDFETKVIHYNPDGRLQTSKRRASVPISDSLLPLLQRSYAERINDLVLDSENRIDDLIRRVAKKAGVKGVSAHTFRHTGATYMARRGLPLWQIAKVLGNSVEEVERTYAKHCPDDLREAVNSISTSRPWSGITNILYPKV